MSHLLAVCGDCLLIEGRGGAGRLGGRESMDGSGYIRTPLSVYTYVSMCDICVCVCACMGTCHIKCRVTVAAAPEQKSIPFL